MPDFPKAFTRPAKMYNTYRIYNTKHTDLWLITTRSIIPVTPRTSVLFMTRHLDELACRHAALVALLPNETYPGLTSRPAGACEDPVSSIKSPLVIPLPLRSQHVTQTTVTAKQLRESPCRQSFVKGCSVATSPSGRSALPGCPFGAAMNLIS